MAADENLGERLEIFDETLNMDFELYGIGIDFVRKGRKKGRKIGK